MSEFATIFCLCYGQEHFALHKRLLESLWDNAPMPSTEIRVWLNDVSQSTRAIAQGAHKVYDNGTANLGKYQAMRKMFNDPEHPIETPWVVWFDDDSYVTDSSWFQTTCDFIRSNPEVQYFGQQWFVHHLKGQWDAIQNAKWFNGLPPALIKGRPGIHFATGGYVWLRTSLMRALDWPDIRLNHNGGDTLLGEACRQAGRPVRAFDKGVKVNDAKRRGHHETPFGSKENVRR